MATSGELDCAVAAPSFAAVVITLGLTAGGGGGGGFCVLILVEEGLSGVAMGSAGGIGFSSEVGDSSTRVLPASCVCVAIFGCCCTL